MWEGQRKFVGSNDLPMTEMSEIVPEKKYWQSLHVIQETSSREIVNSSSLLAL